MLKIRNIPFIIGGTRTCIDFVFKGETELLTEDVIELLKGKSIGIWFNDTTGEHYVCDFEINNVIFECVNALPDSEHIITFNVIDAKKVWG